MNAELLALAVASVNDALNPESEAFKLLNPGLLSHYRHGRRRYSSFQAGLHGLCTEMAKLDCRFLLKDALLKYGIKDIEQEFLLYDFLARATGKEFGSHSKIGDV